MTETEFTLKVRISDEYSDEDIMELRDEIKKMGDELGIKVDLIEIHEGKFDFEKEVENDKQK